MSCVIEAAAMDSIRSHVAAEYPAEGCGMLLGRDVDGERHVSQAIPARNVEAEAATRYTIAAEDFLMAEREARARRLEVVGFYHSHPDVEPTPSATDTRDAWRDYTYVIVGVRAGKSDEVTAWRLGNAGFEPETLTVSASERP